MLLFLFFFSIKQDYSHPFSRICKNMWRHCFQTALAVLNIKLWYFDDFYIYLFFFFFLSKTASRCVHLQIDSLLKNNIYFHIQRNIRYYLLDDQQGFKKVQIDNIVIYVNCTRYDTNGIYSTPQKLIHFFLERPVRGYADLQQKWNREIKW